VFEEHFPDFKVLRADEIKAPGDINSQIIQRLMDAELVIADMSFHNANAFYELAVRHMKRLRTIHIIRKDEKIPFDVALYRAIHFSRQEFKDVSEARSELASVVRAVMAPDFVVENPITHARARFELDQHATPEMQALTAEVAALRDRIDDVQRQVTASRVGVPPGIRAEGGAYTLRGIDLTLGPPVLTEPVLITLPSDKQS
jgi:hypothetical protein